MKKVLFSLALGSLAAASFAQTPGGVPENSVVLGTHVIKNLNLTCTNPEDERPPLQNVTPVTVKLINPNATSKVAGVQARLLYDASLFEFVNPAPAGQDPSCQNAGAGTVITDAAPVINYEAAVGNQGSVNFAIAKETGTTTSGTLVTFFVRAKAGAAPGTVSPFTFDLSNGGERFVVAPETGTATKNAVNGALIVGNDTSSSADAGVAFSSAATDGTRVFAVDNRGVLTVSTPGGANVTANQATANRTGAPTEGRPVIRDGRIVIVSTNGKIQSFDATAANFASQFAPAAAVTLAANATVRSTPAVAGGRIIFTASDGTVHSVDAATGGSPANAAVNASATSSPALVPAAGGNRIAVGGTNSVVILNADLTPVAGVNIATTGNVSSSPAVNAAGIGWVGDDAGNIYTFDVNTGAQIGSALASGEGIRSSPFPTALGALFVGVNGKVTFAGPAGTALGTSITLAPATAPPAGTTLFDVQQAPIIRGATGLIGDTLGNLYQVNVTAAGTTAGPAPRNFGAGAITALASPAAGQVSFLSSRSTLVNTTYTP